MPVKILSYGGVPSWLLRKHASNLTSKIALEYADFKNRKLIARYIDYFLKEEKAGRLPIFTIVNIETVNRCNGKCSFCPANVNEEKRPYKKMSDETFSRIVEELAQLKWVGQIFLNINNEPLIDVKIIERARIIKERLGEKAILTLITNGTILTEEKLAECGKYFDEICINNYSESYKLTRKNKELYSYIKKNPALFGHTDISFRRRYSKEILATRAGAAPNKHKKNNKIESPCIYPFTDISVYPDGVVGLCCNDCFEVTNLGNVNERTLQEIWADKKLSEIRHIMAGGRVNYPFCKECDVADSGFREKMIGSVLH